MPEIPAGHRIFTKAGHNKADYIGGIGQGDYLLDDYNKNLHEFKASGANAIKFRNDINHQGKGAYGGEKGALWSGAMVSYDAAPEEIAKQLAEIVLMDREKRSSLGETISKIAKSMSSRFINQKASIKDNNQTR